MRKLFLSIMSVSAVAVLLSGAVVAWSTSASAGYTASAGSLSVAIANPAGTGNAMYPTGSPITVVTGQIANNTTPPGIAVQVTGGSVASGGYWYDECISAGAVAVTDNNWVGAGSTGGGWSASLTMPSGASDTCQGVAIPYTVTVNVATP